MNTTFNFDEIIDRRGTNCFKYDAYRPALGWDDNEAQQRASYQYWQQASPSQPYEDANNHVIPMWVADMDFRVAPHILEAIHRRMQHPVMGYAVAPRQYWQQVAWWMEHHYQIDPQRGEVHFIPGIVAGIAYAMQALLKADDKVMVFTPVYPPFLSLTTHRQVCVPMSEEEGRFTVDFDLMEQLAPQCRMLLLSNPHNPGGRTWSRSELERIADICHRHHLIVVSDEIHADLVLPNHHHISYPTINSTALNHSITFLAPSKTFNIAGLSSSIGYCPHSSPLHDSFMNYLDGWHIANPTLMAIEATIAAFSQQSESWLEQLCGYLQGNIDLMRQHFAQHPIDANILYPDASFLVWMHFKHLSHEEIRSRLLYDARLGFNDGKDFYADKSFAGHFRINIGCPRQVLQEALNRITRVFPPA